jgi:hypothetical protein
MTREGGCSCGSIRYRLTADERINELIARA